MPVSRKPLARLARCAVVGLSLASGAFVARAQDDAVAYVGARLITVAGADIEQGSILVKDGKIVKVAAGVVAPDGYRKVDCRGRVVMPGFIDMHSHLGIRGGLNEAVESVTPFLHAADGFDPFMRVIDRARSSGVTTMVLAPGDATLVGGRTAVVKMPTSDDVRPDFLRRVADVKISVTAAALQPGRAPTSRAAALETLRTVFANPSGGLADLGAQRARAFVRVANASDIDAALRFTAARGVQLVLVGTNGVGRVASRIGAARAAVVFGPLSFGALDRHLAAPSKVVAAGGRIAFSSGAPARACRDLRLSAVMAVRSGLDQRHAIRALTLSAAEIAGVARRVGSLEVGKDADFVVFDGDPMDLTSRLMEVVVGGERIYRRDAQPEGDARR